MSFRQATIGRLGGPGDTVNAQEEARIHALVEAATARRDGVARDGAVRAEDPAAAAIHHLADAIPEPPTDARAASLGAFLAHADVLRITASPAIPFAPDRARGRAAMRPRTWPPVQGASWRAWAAVAAAAALAVGLGRQVPGALPGDAIYPVKRAIERRQLAAVEGHDVICGVVEFRVAAERRDEVRELLSRGRVEPVAFLGWVTASGDGAFEVDGIPVRLGAAAEIAVRPEVGRRVEIRGRTGDGHVLADWVGEPPPGL